MRNRSCVLFCFIALAVCQQATLTASDTMVDTQSISAVGPLSYQDDGPDYLGMAMTCQFWEDNVPKGTVDPHAFNLDRCEKDLALIKNLGVSWVRLGVPWYYLQPSPGIVNTNRKLFLRRMLEAARNRGLKILFQIGLDVPTWAYSPPQSVISSDLAFSNAAFQDYVHQVVDLAKPYTRHFELFNEVNWHYERFWQGEPSPHGRKDSVLSRMKGLYSIVRAELDAAKASDPSFQPRLLSSGLSFFQDAHCGDAPHPSLIDTSEYLYWMEHGFTPPSGGSYLRNVLDIIAVHPYWSPGTYQKRMECLRNFLEQSDMLGPHSGKSLWATESGPADYSSNGVEVFSDVTQLHKRGVVGKAFWYLIRQDQWCSTAASHCCFASNCCAGACASANDPTACTQSCIDHLDAPCTSCSPLANTDNRLLSINDPSGFTWPHKMPLRNAIMKAARKVPFELRFVDSANPTRLIDFVASASSGAYWGNGYPPSGTRLTLNATTAARVLDVHAPNSRRLSFRLDTYTSVQGDFLNTNIPANGIPTLRVKLAAWAVPPGEGTTPTSVTFYLWMKDVNAPQPRDYMYDVQLGAMPETIEIDLSYFRGKTINLSLAAMRNGTGPVEAVFLDPSIIQR